MTTLVLDSPLGLVRIAGDDAGVWAISCTDVPDREDVAATPLADQLPEPLRLAEQQLQAYFAGTRQTFDFPVNPVGTAFQQTVWRALLDVPFGTTLSYLSLTRRIGDEKAI